MSDPPKLHADRQEYKLPTISLPISTNRTGQGEEAVREEYIAPEALWALRPSMASDKFEVSWFTTQTLWPPERLL